MTEELDFAEAARVMFEASRDRFVRPQQCYAAIEALFNAGFLRDPPEPKEDPRMLRARIIASQVAKITTTGEDMPDYSSGYYDDIQLVKAIYEGVKISDNVVKESKPPSNWGKFTLDKVR